MRFDDSLRTVLAADSSTTVGATLAWRQLVDLVGRGRTPADDVTLTQLRALRDLVPRDVRGASALALAFAQPPAALVGLFAEDEPGIAAPVLRTAALDAYAWQALLPRLSPGGRSILRHRRDLPAETVQALQAFGPVDFVLPEPASYGVTPANDEDAPAAPVVSTPAPDATAELPIAPLHVPSPEEHFVPVGTIARNIPGLADLLAAPPPEQRIEEYAPSAAAAEATAGDMPVGSSAAERFEISDLVARIDAYQRQERPPVPLGQAELFDLSAPPARSFRFESDTDGVIRWVDAVERGALIGLPLGAPAALGHSGVDGSVVGAFRRRASFTDARLVVIGRSSAAGQWRIGAVPAFDPNSGRFTGYLGSARRPRRDEIAEALSPQPDTRGAEAMRQLVHELRTPLNAIAGFAEMIDAELLGPVASEYRGYAGTIRGQADRLLAGIDDLDMAARVESGTLELRPEPIPLVPLLRRIAADLRPLADLRGATVAVSGAEELTVAADVPAVERLAARLLATLVGAAGRGETVVLDVTADAGQVTVSYDRPIALDLRADDAPSDPDDIPGVSLLGTDFALRLAANLAREQGGSLVIAADALTLRLPAAVIAGMEQASIR